MCCPGVGQDEVGQGLAVELDGGKIEESEALVAANKYMRTNSSLVLS